jgi:hypothetical protein
MGAQVRDGTRVHLGPHLTNARRTRRRAREVWFLLVGAAEPSVVPSSGNEEFVPAHFHREVELEYSTNLLYFLTSKAKCGPSSIGL